MKKLIFFLVSFVGQLLAQDTIVFRNQEIKVVKVSEVGVDEVKYHRFDNLEGPQYIANKNEIKSIKYKSGNIDTFKVSEPVVVAQAQSNTASAQLITVRGKKLIYGRKGISDAKLLRMINDYPYPKTKSIMLKDFAEYKAYRRNQYISGFVGLGVGIISLWTGIFSAGLSNDVAPFFVGLVVGAGVGITGAVVSGVMKNKRVSKRLEIARLYNEMK